MLDFFGMVFGKSALCVRSEMRDTATPVSTSIVICFPLRLNSTVMGRVADFVPTVYNWKTSVVVSSASDDVATYFVLEAIGVLLRSGFRSVDLDFLPDRHTGAICPFLPQLCMASGFSKTAGTRAVFPSATSITQGAAAAFSSTWGKKKLA